MGTPEKVVNLFTFIAEEIREILSQLGFSSLNQIIGRSDLLKQVSRGSADLDDLDLSPLLIQADPGENKRYCEDPKINYVPDTVDQKIWPEILNNLDNKTPLEDEYLIESYLVRVSCSVHANINIVNWWLGRPTRFIFTINAAKTRICLDL